MTVPREWPNDQRKARDKAAEESAAALRWAAIMAQKGDLLTRDDINFCLLNIINHTQNALRWLESAGAQTRPIDQSTL